MVPHVVRFGTFEVDLRSGELRRNGLAVRLQHQPFQILAMLLERPGELVTREEIRHKLWPADTFVDFEHSLNAAIKRLREALGESAERPVFIETLPRRGYRIRIPVQTPASAPEIAEAPVLPRARWKTYTWYIAGVSALAIVSLAALRAWHIVPFRTSEASMPPMRVVPFTTFPGAEFDAAFSPDGRAIAFVWYRDSHDKADLYIKLVGGDQPLRITHRAGWVCNPAWSPDGRYLAFQSASGSVGTFIVPALTGPERKVSAQAACHGLTWSRDGKFLAYPVKASPAERWRIALLSLDTMEERQITSPPANTIGDHGPCFSPDSKTIAYARISSPWLTDLYLSPIEGGPEKRLTFDKTVIWGCTWTGDGKSVVITSHRGGDLSLWRVPLSGGSPERLSVASPTAYYPAISPQGDKLAYRTGTLHTNIWRLGLNALGRATAGAKPLMQSTVGDEGPDFSPDGSHVVFDSQRSGSPEIWIASADGSDPIQLTYRNVLSGSPRWSPDGRQIAFDSRTGDHSQIFVIHSVGGAPRQVTHGEFEASVPTWSPDGQSIYFTSNRMGIWQLFKVPVQGGEPTQVTATGGFIAFEEPDGKGLYYSKDNDYGIWRMPLPNGKEERILPVKVDWGRWALTRKGIYFVDDGPTPPTISFYRFADRRIAKIAAVERPLFHGVPGFSVSPDGRTVLFLQVEMETDLMLVENFR